MHVKQPRYWHLMSTHEILVVFAVINKYNKIQVLWVLSSLPHVVTWPAKSFIYVFILLSLNNAASVTKKTTSLCALWEILCWYLDVSHSTIQIHSKMNIKTGFGSISKKMSFCPYLTYKDLLIFKKRSNFSSLWVSEETLKYGMTLN